MTLNPKKYQQYAIDLIKQSSTGFIVADECGLGKTLVAIEAAPEEGRFLVVCPPKVMEQWAQVLYAQRGANALIARRVPFDFSQVFGWVIISYPELLYSPLMTQIGAVLWDYVVFDEAHRLKNRKKKTFEHAQTIPRVKAVLLTGTPMEKSPTDLWSLLHIVAEDEFPSYWSYVDKWLEKTPGYFTTYEIGGPLDPPAFGQMLTNYMVRRTKDQVLPELPEKIIVNVSVEPDSKQASALMVLREMKDIIVAVEDKELLIKNVLARLVRAHQISTEPRLLEFAFPSGKVQWLGELIADHPDEPIVVFTKFREAALLWAAQFNGAFVVGGDDTYNDFLIGHANLLFCVIDAVEGIDGMQKADIAVFMDQHWSTIKMTQAIDRLHRVGITRPKTLYMLHSSLEDELVLKALDEKWSEAELVFFYMDALA